jgi:hypothetical protein
VDVRFADDRKSTALHAAANLNSLPLINFFLGIGFDVNCRDEARATPLHRAGFRGHVEALEVLLAAGACPAAKDVSGWDVLRCAPDTPAAPLIVPPRPIYYNLMPAIHRVVLPSATGTIGSQHFCRVAAPLRWICWLPTTLRLPPPRPPPLLQWAVVHALR